MGDVRALRVDDRGLGAPAVQRAIGALRLVVGGGRVVEGALEDRRRGATRLSRRLREGLVGREGRRSWMGRRSLVMGRKRRNGRRRIGRVGRLQLLLVALGNVSQNVVEGQVLPDGLEELTEGGDEVTALLNDGLIVVDDAEEREEVAGAVDDVRVHAGLVLRHERLGGRAILHAGGGHVGLGEDYKRGEGKETRKV